MAAGHAVRINGERANDGIELYTPAMGFHAHGWRTRTGPGTATGQPVVAAADGPKLHGTGARGSPGGKHVPGARFYGAFAGSRRYESLSGGWHGRDLTPGDRVGAGVARGQNGAERGPLLVRNGKRQRVRSSPKTLTSSARCWSGIPAPRLDGTNNGISWSGGWPPEGLVGGNDAR